MATSGDIREITCNHPTLGSFVFFSKAGETSNYDLGGYVSNDDEAGVDSSGAMIDQMQLKRWMFECTLGWDMNNRQDLEKLRALQSDPLPADWTFTHINSTVYAGTGKPVGNIAGDAGAGTIALKVAGGGIMSVI